MKIFITTLHLVKLFCVYGSVVFGRAQNKQRGLPLFYSFLSSSSFCFAMIFVSQISLAQAGEESSSGQSVFSLQSQIEKSGPASMIVLLGQNESSNEHLFSDQSMRFALAEHSLKSPVILIDSPINNSQQSGLPEFVKLQQDKVLAKRPIVLAVDQKESSPNIEGFDYVRSKDVHRDISLLVGMNSTIRKVTIAVFEGNAKQMNHLMRLLAFLRIHGPQELRVQVKLITASDQLLKEGYAATELALAAPQLSETFPELFTSNVSLQIFDATTDTQLMVNRDAEAKIISSLTEGYLDRASFLVSESELDERQAEEIFEKVVTDSVDRIRNSVSDALLQMEAEIALRATPELQELESKIGESRITELLYDSLIHDIEFVPESFLLFAKDPIEADQLSLSMSRVLNNVRKQTIRSAQKTSTMARRIKTKVRELLKQKML